MYDYADGHYNRSEKNGALMEPYRDYRGVEVVGAWGWYDMVAFGLAAEEDAADSASLFALRRPPRLVGGEARSISGADSGAT